MKIKTQIDIAIKAAGLVTIGYCSGLFTTPWVNSDLPILWTGLYPLIPPLFGIVLMAATMKSIRVEREQVRRELLRVPKLRWVALGLLVATLTIPQVDVHGATGSAVGTVVAFLVAVSGIVLWRHSFQVPADTTKASR